MTIYNLSVDLVDVDLITGVQLVFQGNVPGGQSSDDFVQAVTPAKSSVDFKLRGDGKRLIGLLSFQPVLANPRFVDDGETYNFVDPGQYRIVMRNKKPVRLMSIDLPRTSPAASPLLVAFGFPPLKDPFLLVNHESLV